MAKQEAVARIICKHCLLREPDDWYHSSTGSKVSKAWQIPFNLAIADKILKVLDEIDAG